MNTTNITASDFSKADREDASCAVATTAKNHRANHTISTISRSAPCADCGYDLLGLSTNGHCPECDHSNIASVRTMLHFAPPAHLRLLQRGAGDLLLGWLALAAGGAGVVAMYALGPDVRDERYVLSETLRTFLIIISLVFSVSLGASGWWRLTALETDPRRRKASAPDLAMSIRVLTVVSTSLAALATAIGVVWMMYFALPNQTRSPNSMNAITPQLFIALGYGAALTILVRHIMGMLHLNRLGKRAASKRLARRAWTLLWGDIAMIMLFFTLSILIVASALASIFEMLFYFGWLFSIIPVLVFALALLIDVVMQIALYARLRRELARLLNAANTT